MSISGPPKHSHISHSPEYALMGFLAESPAHGYELHQRLAAEMGHIWHVSQSQTYLILKRLEGQGFVAAKKIEQKKLPARQLLHLTAAGNRRFNAWLTEPTGSSVRAIRVDFLTRLYFLGRTYPGKVEGVIAGQIDEVRSAVRRLEETLKTIPPAQTINRLGVELRIRQLRSILDFLGEVVEEFAVVA